MRMMGANRRLVVVGADHLGKSGDYEKFDPFCVVYWNGERVLRTGAKMKTVEPRWEESCLLAVEPRRANTLRLEVYNRTEANFMGMAEVPLGQCLSLVNSGPQGIPVTFLFSSCIEATDMNAGERWCSATWLRTSASRRDGGPTTTRVG